MHHHIAYPYNKKEYEKQGSNRPIPEHLEYMGLLNDALWFIELWGHFHHGTSPDEFNNNTIIIIEMCLVV